MTARRLLVRASENGVLLAILALVAYGWLSSPYLVGNDNAEFSTLGAVGGIAHPSTYPGYILWLRAWSWLPIEPAHTAALATALLAAASIYVLHAACRAWGAKPIAATIAVGLYAAAPLVVRYSTEAEAFAPNQLAVALVLWLAATNGPLRGRRRAFVLGLVAGLGMTNHMTCTLVAPVGLLGVIRGVRESEGPKAVPVVLAVTGLVLGWTPYLYLFVASDNVLGYPRPTTISAFLDLVLRRQYGGAFAFSGTEGAVDHIAQLRSLMSSLGRAWVWLLLPVGLGALGWRIARPADGEPRAGWIALALTFLLAGPMLALKFNVDTAEIGLHVIHRFHLLPTLLLVIPVAVGLTWIGARLAPRMSDSARAGRVWTPLAYLGFAGVMVVALPDVGRYRTPAMENMVRNTLTSMPRDAVILAGNVDELDVGIRYLQLARGERPDVLFFRWRDAAVDWYREKFVPYGLTLPQGKPVSGDALVRLFLARGRPVFVYWWEKELRAVFPSYPFGVLVRLLPPGTTPPSLDAVFELNRELFLTFDLAYPPPGKHDEFATWVHRKYAGTWGRLADDLQRAGKAAEAATAVELARALGPQAD